VKSRYAAASAVVTDATSTSSTGWNNPGRPRSESEAAVSSTTNCERVAASILSVFASSCANSRSFTSRAERARRCASIQIAGLVSCLKNSGEM